MHIHFICTGNAYRSRLAETYLKSKKIKGVKVSSSGTHAEGGNGPICWYAMRLITKHSLIPYIKSKWNKTNKNHIAKANLIVFMEQHHFDYVQNSIGLKNKQYEIWNIRDLDEINILSYEDVHNREQDTITHSEITFEKIKEKVDNLVTTLSL